MTMNSEYGRALMQFFELEKGMHGQLLGYIQALSEIQREEGIMIMSIEGSEWSPVICRRNSQARMNGYIHIYGTD